VGAALIGGVSRVRVDTGAESFLPAHDPTMAAVQQQAREFGGDPVIVLLRYPVARQFVSDAAQTHALSQLESELAKLPDVATVYGPATVLDQLVGATRGFIARVTELRTVTRAQAEQAAAAAGRSPADVSAAGQAAVDVVNERYAPLILRALPLGMPSLDNPTFLQAMMFGPDGLAKPQWRFIVPGTDAVAVLVRPRQDMDQGATQRLVDAVRATVNAARLDVSTVTISGVPTVTAELTEQVVEDAPLTGLLVALAVLLRYLLVPAPGSRWQRLRPLIAAALGSAATVSALGWSGRPMSLGAVVLLPLLLGVGSSFPLYLATVPNRRRVVVMSVASALAFLALALSPLPFVRDLGIALALGMLLTVGAALLLNRFWPPPSIDAPDDLAVRAPTAPDDLAVRAPTAPRLTVVRAVILVVAVVVAGAGWWALPRITVTANPTELAKGLPALEDVRKVEDTLGASGEISVRLTGPNTVSQEALIWANDAERVLAERFGEQLLPVVGVSSLFGFLGPAPTAEQIAAGLAVTPPYLSSAVVRPDRQVSLLIYGLRLQDLGAQQRLLTDVRAALPAPPAGYSAELVGLPVAAARGYELLLGDRYLANLAGIVVAGLVLVLGLRRRWDAARAVAAAGLATGWGLGLIWALGGTLSPLTMALGSLVTVTGSEFVVLLAEARRRARPWLWRSVGVACVTSVLGYLALVPSRLSMVHEFGLVMGAAVLLSYLAARLIMWVAPPPVPRGSPAAPQRLAVMV